MKLTIFIVSKTESFQRTGLILRQSEYTIYTLQLYCVTDITTSAPSAEEITKEIHFLYFHISVVFGECQTKTHVLLLLPHKNFVVQR